LFTAGLQVPLIPLLEIAGKVKVPPGQIAGIWVNAGRVEELFTDTVMVVSTAHCPAVGVKVYVVVEALLTAGLHVPLTPLLEIVGNVKVPPEQIAGIWLNVGVRLLFTITVMVDVTAHWPAFGVNVYIFMVVLSVAGLHVPLIPLVEVAGSVIVPPEQMVGTCVNAGIVPLLTVTVMVAGNVHCPAFGVKI